MPLLLEWLHAPLEDLHRKARLPPFPFVDTQNHFQAHVPHPPPPPPTATACHPLSHTHTHNAMTSNTNPPSHPAGPSWPPFSLFYSHPVPPPCLAQSPSMAVQHQPGPFPSLLVACTCPRHGGPLTYPRPCHALPLQAAESITAVMAVTWPRIPAHSPMLLKHLLKVTPPLANPSSLVLAASCSGTHSCLSPSLPPSCTQRSAVPISEAVHP